MSTVQRWLAALGDAAIESYPPLAVLAGWIAVFTGQTVEAERWAAIVDAASFDRVPADGSASFESARAMFRALMCAAGPEQMLADATFAVGPGAAVEPVARHGARACWPRRSCSTGDVEQAAAAVRRGVALAAAHGQHRLARVSEAELAVLAMDRGRWAEAAEHVERRTRRHRRAPDARLRDRACSPSPSPPGSRCTEAT